MTLAELANLAAVVAIFIGLFGGYVALRTYLAGAQSAANAEMHGLFRDYLRLRFDYALHAAETPPKAGGEAVPSSRLSESLLDQLAGLKLYALEQMFAWTRREERLFVIFPLDNSRRSHQGDVINSWKATILVHARQENAGVRKSIINYTRCYSVDFLEFIAADWKDDGLKTIVAKHRDALERKCKRPPGRLEEAPLSGERRDD